MFNQENTGTRRSKGKSVLTAIIAIIVVLFVLAQCSCSVPTGHTGVITTFGKVENYVFDSGFHFKAPWQQVVKMDNRVQKQSVDLLCFSSDIQEVSMVYTINYQISKSDAMTIYSTIGQSYYNTVITPCITECVKTVTARYTAEQLVGMRSELASSIEKVLAAKLDMYHIELVSTSVENMDFTDVFTNAVEAKQVAAQDKLTAQTKAEQQIIEAKAQSEVKVIEAKAEADAMIAKAEAEAEATRITAEAEAEANRKMSESLSENVIDYTRAKQWDGKYPTYYGGDSTALLDLR